MSYILDFSSTSDNPVPLMELSNPQELNERMLARAYAMVAEAERLIAKQRERIKTLESLSFTDELTGLVNRRAFEMALSRELAAVSRDPSQTGTVIMVDLDGFKQINDRFGHAAGDAYLVAVAEVLRGALRETDTVARLGGDEFAILLPHTRSSAGARRCVSLQVQLNTAALAWQGLSLPLRASFGAAHFSGGDSLADVMKRADARLYGDKGTRKARRASV